MKRIIVCVIVCLFSILAGCVRKEPADSQTAEVSNTEKTTSVKEQTSDIEVWEKKQELNIEEKTAQDIEIPACIAEEEMLNMKVFQADINHDGAIDCVCIYEKDMPEYGHVRKIRAYDYLTEQEINILDAGMELTAQQKNELADIVAYWYENGFGKRARKNYMQEGFKNILLSSIQYTIIDCDGQSMICMSFETEQIQAFAEKGFEGDKVQVLLSYSDGRFIVYDAWFEGKWRFAAQFSS